MTSPIIAPTLVDLRGGATLSWDAEGAGELDKVDELGCVAPANALVKLGVGVRIGAEEPSMLVRRSRRMWWTSHPLNNTKMNQRASNRSATSMRLTGVNAGLYSRNAVYTVTIETEGYLGDYCPRDCNDRSDRLLNCLDHCRS